MTAFLPQHDPHSQRREKELASRRAEYQYCYDYVSPLALCEHVPFRDEFAIRWIINIGERLLNVLANVIELEHTPHLKEAHHKNHRLFKGLVEAATFDLEAMLKTIQDAVEMGGEITRPDSYEEYATLFRTIGLPPIHRDYRSDEMFAEMRIAGPNPVMLQRIDQPDDRFPVTNQDFQITLPDDSIEAASQEGRLFLCDYKLLENLEKSDFPCEKFLYVPLAMFAVDKKTKRLVPIAIQCNQTPGRDNPVFTPDDGINWLIAKTVVGMADGNIHEPVSHLARTHLFIEPFVIATQRHLATRHPLGLLLRPHFEGTLHINNLAHRYLIAPRNGVHRMCNGTIESIGGMIVKGLQNYPFNSARLPDQLKQRGVDDTDAFPHYPFRDDSQLYWNAIQEWVSEFLAIYYETDAAVQADVELQAWFRELIAQDGGRVIGLGESGNTLVSRKYLIDMVTMIIYTGSVQHAAVNFPQYDLMSYTCAMPLACYGEVPKSKKGATEEDLLKILPPLELANLQMCLGYGLGSLYYTKFGHYGFGHFRDHRVAAPLKRFKQRIKEIGKTINERNEHRRPYKFLHPTGIPQSINI